MLMMDYQEVSNSLYILARVLPSLGNISEVVEKISIPVWLGWSITIECMIGATLLFLMISSKEKNRSETYQNGCDVM